MMWQTLFANVCPMSIDLLRGLMMLGRFCSKASWSLGRGGVLKLHFIAPDVATAVAHGNRERFLHRHDYCRGQARLGIVTIKLQLNLEARKSERVLDANSDDEISAPCRQFPRCVYHECHRHVRDVCRQIIRHANERGH